FRRILQIGVYLHDGITTGMEVICQDGALETKVFRKPDGPYTSIAGGKIRKDFPGPVTGMVVRKDKFKITPIVHARRQGTQAGVKRIEISFLVKHRNGNRYQGFLCLIHWLSNSRTSRTRARVALLHILNYGG